MHVDPVCLPGAHALRCQHLLISSGWEAGEHHGKGCFWCFSGQKSKRWYFCNPVAKAKKNPKPKTIVCVELWHVVPMTRSESAGWVQVPVVGWTQSPGLIQLLMQRCPLLLGVLWGNKAVGYATGCRKDPCSVEVLQDIPVCLSDARWWKASS